MSPRRWGQNVQVWVYRYLVERDGEQCARCYAKAGVQNDNTVPLKLEIDHVDGDPFNHTPDNLRLLCKDCNIRLRNHPELSHSPKNVCVSERELKEGNASTRIVRQAVGYSHPDSPVTMQANFLFEVDARAWVLEKVAEKGFYPKQDAITGMAELVGCSVATSTRYLMKLTSPVGCLQEVKDMLGSVMLMWKEGYKPEPTIKIDLDKGIVHTDAH